MIAMADTFNGPYPNTVDGIGWAYGGEDLSNYSADYVIYFSAPVSYFEFSAGFPIGAMSPGVATNSQYTSVTINNPLVPYLGPTATVTGTAPNVTSMYIGLSESPYSPSLFYASGVVFTNLNNPPSTGITQTPEPAMLTLSGLVLLAIVLGRRWLTRSDKAGSSERRGLAPPALI